MTGKIRLYHYALSRDVYEARLANGYYSNNWPDSKLGLSRIDNPNIAFFRAQIERMDPKLYWNRQAKLSDPDFEKDYLRGPESSLYLLLDDGREVGFALVKSVPQRLHEKFFAVSSRTENISAIEVSYLGLFKGEAGRNRGKTYFEMLFARHFTEYERVYWSQHSTNAPSLAAFYQERMGMELIDVEEIDDFRPEEATQIMAPASVAPAANRS